MEKKNKVITAVVIFLLLMSAAILVLCLHFTFFESARFVLGSIFVLFLPGFVWSFVLTSADKTLISNADKTLIKNKLSYTDRIILSIGLSFVISPLFVFILSKIGIKINFINSFIEICALILIGLSIFLVKKFLNKRNA